MNRTVLLVGIVFTAALLAVLYFGLGKDPQHIDSPLIGRPAPDFALKAVGSGETIGLSKYRGKPVVLNFWATWCRPCWDEHPTLTATARGAGDQVQFVGIVFQDEESKILDFLRARGWAYPTLVDEKGKTAIAYGIGGVPETFFLDKNGNIVAKYEGPMTPEIIQENLAKAMAVR
jgi:cytochrome c biogenesis protein CcmG, thiol:disulfide interchange protein DsbE